MSLFKVVPQFTRGYATASKAIQAPLTLHGLDGRYATALYTASVKSNTLDAVESDLKKFKAFLEKSAKLKFVLEDPTLKIQEKKTALTATLQVIKASKTTSNLFDVLIENRRLAETHKIINSYLSLMSAHRGELQITVTSAQPLEDNLLKQLKDTLAKSSVASGSKSVTISNQVKPAILGGLVIEFGDKTIDLSVSGKISKLSKALTGNFGKIDFF